MPVPGLGFVAAAQMLSQEHLGCRIELHAVVRLTEPMPLIREKHVFILNTLYLHRLDNLFRLGLFNPDIIGTLGDQNRDLNLINLEQG